MVNKSMSKTYDFFKTLNNLFPDERSVLNNYDDFSKLLRKHLLAMNFKKAVRAHDMAARNHRNTRRDDTPEFLHQQSQALYSLAFARAGLVPKFMLHDLICADFTHDLLEDYYEIIKVENVELETTPRVARFTEILSKKDPTGEEKNLHQYYNTVAMHPVTLVAKIFDRIHNQSTRVGGFSSPSIKSYNETTKTDYFILIAKGRIFYPMGMNAFQELEQTLRFECDMIDRWLSGDNLLTSPPLKGFDLLPDGLNPVKIMLSRMEKTPYAPPPNADNTQTLRFN